jgi:hypothetical protein
MQQAEATGHAYMEAAAARPLDILCDDDNWEEEEEEEEDLAAEFDPGLSTGDGPSSFVQDPVDELDILGSTSNSSSSPLLSSNPPAQQNQEHTGDTTQPPLAASEAQHVPHDKKAENEPDPFYNPESTMHRAPFSTDARSSLHGGIYLLYTLVAWLHLQFHLPLRACTVIVQVVMLILQLFGNIVEPKPLTTPSAIFSVLGLEPEVEVLPICTNCFEVFASNPLTPTICSKCSTFIFKPLPLPSSTLRPPLRTPKLCFPYKTLESQLRDMLSVPGLEAELDEWRKIERKAGVYQDNFDGNICKNLKAHDGSLFFANGPAEMENGPDGELRIALTLGANW